MSEQQQTLTIQQALELAVQHHNEGRLSQAETIYNQILQSNPDQPIALQLLGVIAHQTGNNDKAVDLITKALAIKPDYADAHNNLANVLKELGRLDEAAAGYRKAIELKPDYADAHNNLGTVFHRLDKTEDAVASYRKALNLKPDFAEAHSNLGLTLGQLGRPIEAIISHRHAISLNPQNEQLAANFAYSLETASFTSVDDNLYQDLLYLLERASVRPSRITAPIITALRIHPDFSPILETVNSAQQDGEVPYSTIAEKLSAIPLFLRLLDLTPIFDVEVERMLTALRSAMLRETTERRTDDKGMPFSTALALHCFTNEYVFAETEEETAAIEDLQRQVAAAVENGRDVPPPFVISLGAYRPLFSFPWAQQLTKQQWKEDIKTVIKRQITEQLEEGRLRKQIPCITQIRDTISQSVREQYEENPYPRWIKTDIHYKNRTLGAVLEGSPLFFDLGEYSPPKRLRVLAAGCGTGQHVLQIASRFSSVHVLALDLSLSSLAYAQRKTKELSFSNIEYVQGDILELAELGRRFDLISCTGVLHHLEDPLVGWQVLTDLLRPGGIMNIGLYSEIAHQHLIAGRSLISEKGYSTSPEDIRRCRQDIMKMADDGNPAMAKICDTNDFFNTSECRDLLFHVQEQRLTLPQIEAALTSLQLKFLGFEMRDQRTLRKFKDSHPDRSALISLSQWHEFELENPDTFIGMYQFWCQKL